MNESTEMKKNAGASEATLANWRTSPVSKWTFHHVRELIPSAEIRNDPQLIWKLKEQKAPFQTSNLESIIQETSTDAVVIIHNNEIIFESYQNGMDSDDQHILFSVSKSILGLLAGRLIQDGIINEFDLITDYLPEMRGTAYDIATIRELLDMRVGVSFDEDYAAKSGPMIDYRYAANWNPTPEARIGITLKSFLTSLKQSDGPNGQNFHYVSPNTDLLAWVFEEAAKRRYTDLLSDYIWKPLGSERSAYITVDRIGGMRAAGGICATARDLGRLGMLLAQNGLRENHQIISANWIKDLYEGGSHDAWNKGTFKNFFESRSMHYRSQWYVCHEVGRLIYGFGIHGQYLFVDPDRHLSIVWLSSEESPLNSEISRKIINMVTDIRLALHALESLE